MSGSKIRTATETSGKPRRRRWTLRALTAVVVTTGSLVSLAGPAQAYDSNTCSARLPVPVTDVDQFKLSAGSVDFGDGWHLFGAPVGDAVVCWGGGGGDIAISGNLYADSPTSINIAVDVRYYRAAGSGTTTSNSVYFFGRNGESKAVPHIMPGGAAFDRVRIRLWLCGVTPSDGTCSLVNAETFHRGDVNGQ